MNLPDDAKNKASEFKQLSAERKNQIITHLETLNEEQGQRAKSQIIQNGGDEAKFIQHIFGNASPQNKKAVVGQTK